jgi:hypothetical protein
MAVVDNATLVIGTGNYFIAPYNAVTPQALPADLTTIPSPWEAIGHTSLDEVISFTSEGGEATTVGTLQNKQLRTTYTTRTETINITLQQWDESGLKLYYGSNATVGTNGEIQVPINPTPTTVSFLAVFIDGENQFAVYAPKVEIFRADDIAVADTESLAGLPLSVKPLIHSTNEWAYAVTPVGGAGS